MKVAPFQYNEHPPPEATLTPALRHDVPITSSEGHFLSLQYAFINEALNVSPSTIDSNFTHPTLTIDVNFVQHNLLMQDLRQRNHALCTWPGGQARLLCGLERVLREHIPFSRGQVLLPVSRRGFSLAIYRKMKCCPSMQAFICALRAGPGGGLYKLD